MLDQLNHKSYLKNEMIDELDLVTGNQLKDCTISFHKKKRNRFAISEMFSCELKFDSDCLKR